MVISPKPSWSNELVTTLILLQFITLPEITDLLSSLPKCRIVTEVRCYENASWSRWSRHTLDLMCQQKWHVGTALSVTSATPMLLSSPQQAKCLASHYHLSRVDLVQLHPKSAVTLHIEATPAAAALACKPYVHTIEPIIEMLFHTKMPTNGNFYTRK